MIDLITPYIEDAYQRQLPPYQTFLKSQSVFLKEKWKRLYASQGYENSGIQLLRYILNFIDQDYLNRLPNNYERYSNFIRHIRRQIMNIFDGHRRGKSFKYLFFAKTRYITHEYLLPIEDLNSIINLPLHTEDWHVWKRVRVLRLWTHDSDELSTCMISDRARFFEMPPGYAVELLDVVALLFKYYIWRKHQRMFEPARDLALHIPQQLFLHKYVMCDWVWDLGNIWLLRNMIRLLHVEDQDQLQMFSNQNLRSGNPQYGWVSNDSYRGYLYLWKLLQDTTRSIRPEAVLSSKTLFNGSINQRIELVANRLVLPIHRQYDYLRWLRDKDLVWFFLRIYARQPGLPKTKRIFIEVRRQLNRLINQRPWNVCNYIPLRDSIEKEMHHLLNWCDEQSLPT